MALVYCIWRGRCSSLQRRRKRQLLDDRPWKNIDIQLLSKENSNCNWYTFANIMLRRYIQRIKMPPYSFHVFLSVDRKRLPSCKTAAPFESRDWTVVCLTEVSLKRNQFNSITSVSSTNTWKISYRNKLKIMLPACSAKSMFFRAIWLGHRLKINESRLNVFP